MYISIKSTLLQKLKEILIKNNLTVSTAESCTGGLISKKITDIPGSSKFFIGGVVTYQNKSKEKILNVEKNIIDKLTAVSEPVAKAMAINVRNLFESDFSISTTGYAGPNHKDMIEPTGLVFIGISSKNNTIVYKEKFKGSRNNIREETAEKAIKYLIKHICQEI